MTPRNHLTERGGTVTRKTKVRTTIEPGVVLAIDDAELLDLDRQGLIHSSDAGHGSHEWRPEVEADADAAPAATDTKPAKPGKTEKGATS